MNSKYIDIITKHIDNITDLKDEYIKTGKLDRDTKILIKYIKKYNKKIEKYLEDELKLYENSYCDNDGDNNDNNDNNDDNDNDLGKYNVYSFEKDAYYASDDNITFADVSKNESPVELSDIIGDCKNNEEIENEQINLYSDEETENEKLEENETVKEMLAISKIYLNRAIKRKMLQIK